MPDERLLDGGRRLGDGIVEAVPRRVLLAERRLLAAAAQVHVRQVGVHRPVGHPLHGCVGRHRGRGAGIPLRGEALLRAAARQHLRDRAVPPAPHHAGQPDLRRPARGVRCHRNVEHLPRGRAPARHRGHHIAELQSPVPPLAGDTGELALHGQRGDQLRPRGEHALRAAASAVAARAGRGQDGEDALLRRRAARLQDRAPRALRRACVRRGHTRGVVRPVGPPRGGRA